jgi:hypothetical protein
MKNCKYCAESIQDEAIKCKHCGEWLDNKVHLDINSVKESLSEGAQNVGTKVLKWKDELFGSNEFIEPTNSNPLVIDNLKLMSDSFSFEGKVYSYDQIASIYYKIQSSKTNGINIGTWYDLIIYVDVDNNFPLEKRLDKGKLRVKQYSSIIYWAPKANKLIHNAYFVLCERSFKYRYEKYKKVFQANGFFNYPTGILVHNNGTIEKGIKKIDFKNSLNLGLVKAGFSMKLIRSSHSDPYFFMVSSSSKMFAPSIDFELYYDKDLFEYLVSEFADNGSFFIL